VTMTAVPDTPAPTLAVRRAATGKAPAKARYRAKVARAKSKKTKARARARAASVPLIHFSEADTTPYLW